MTEATEEMSAYLTPEIITSEGNVLFHCEWANLNKIPINVHGSNVVNSAAVIKIQELKLVYWKNLVRTLPQYERSEPGSFNVDLPETLPEVNIYNRVGPSFPQGSPFNQPKENATLYAAIKQEYYAWTICRKFGSDGKQPVPALGGYISATGTPPLRKQPLIIYFIPIHQPITDYSTVQELLKRSEVATA